MIVKLFNNSNVKIKDNVTKTNLISKKFQYGRTHLQVASRFSKTNNVKTIFDKLKIFTKNNNNQRYINLSNSEDKTSIMLATDYINHVNSKGKTALILAAEYGDKTIVEILLDNGAEIEKKNSKGSAALILAVYYGNNDVVELLVEKGANINIQNNYGSNALMYASVKGNVNIINFLLNNGARINDIDENGNNALIYAIMYIYWADRSPDRSLRSWKSDNENLIIVKLLCERGINIRYENKKKMNAYDFAHALGLNYVCKYLNTHLNKSNRINNVTYSPLHKSTRNTVNTKNNSSTLSVLHNIKNILP